MDPIEPEQELSKAKWEGIKGKVKEAVGSALGSQGLIADGELQQAEAEAHKRAAALKEDADRLRDQAAERFAAQEQVLADARAQTRQAEIARLAQIEGERDRQQRAIDEEAQARVRAAHQRAEENRREAETRQQRAAREREVAGREAAEHRSAAIDLRASAADLDAIADDLAEGSPKEE